MREVWRIAKARHLTAPLSGEGARRYPGRWHPRGTPLLYTAQSLSLAALEVFVHLPAQHLLPSDLMAVRIRVPEAVSVASLSIADLPLGWDAVHPLPTTQTIGLEWAKQGNTCALEVPSAVIPWEKNLLLNPAHPEFPRVHVVFATPFRFDPRMDTQPP